MPTYKGEVIKNQILIHSAVSTPDATGSNRYIRKGPLYTALVDTGAQKTLISPGAASEVGLISSGTDWIIPVSGKPVNSGDTIPNYELSIVSPEFKHPVEIKRTNSQQQEGQGNNQGAESYDDPVLHRRH